MLRCFGRSVPDSPEGALAPLASSGKRTTTDMVIIRNQRAVNLLYSEAICVSRCCKHRIYPGVVWWGQMSRWGAAVVAAVCMRLSFYAKLDEESPSHTTYLGSISLLDRLKEATFEVFRVARRDPAKRQPRRPASPTASRPLSRSPSRPPGRSKSHLVQAHVLTGVR